MYGNGNWFICVLFFSYLTWLQLVTAIYSSVCMVYFCFMGGCVGCWKW